MISKAEARQFTAANVRRIRKALGMTQVELSKKSGVDQGTISKLERAQVLLNSADLHNIAEALNSSSDVLLKPVEKVLEPA